jgi:hypothetical protein
MKKGRGRKRRGSPTYKGENWAVEKVISILQ